MINFLTTLKIHTYYKNGNEVNIRKYGTNFHYNYSQSFLKFPKFMATMNYFVCLLLVLKDLSRG